MSPEVLCGQNHNFAADYFAVGVIGYEFMNGKRPYIGKNRKEIKEKIMSKQIKIKKNDLEQNWSLESADCINRLLERKPYNRLGYRGATEVKEHSWFKYYSWKDLYLGKLTSPFIPKIGDNYDHKFCNKPDNIGIDTQERYYKILNGNKIKTVFKEFYYFNRDYEENNKDNEDYAKKNFKNPHLYIYYDENEESTDTNDAAVINRNIFNNNKNEDEIYTEIKKNYVGPYMLYNLFNNNNNNNNRHNHYGVKKGNRTTLSFMMNKGNSINNNNNESNMSSSFRNLSFINRKNNNSSKTSGYGY